MRCTFSARFTTWNQAENARTRSRAAAGRSPLHARGELDPRLRIAVAATDGADAILFDEVEERGAALLAQDVAHERAQGMHILTQRCVLRREKDLAAIHDEAWILTRAGPASAVISARRLRRWQNRLLQPAQATPRGLKRRAWAR